MKDYVKVIIFLGIVIYASAERLSKVCHTNSYKCADGSCIDRHLICDGKIDCKTSIDDEEHCETCDEGFYRCADNGTCINENLICDHKKDCMSFGDDEFNCDEDITCFFHYNPINCSCEWKSYNHYYAKALICYGANLVSLPERIFKNVEELDLKDNKLGLFGALRDFAFLSYEKLEILRLDKNHIVNLSPYLFQNITTLEILSLCENSIQELPKGIFTNVENLEIIDLRSNKIKNVDNDTFDEVVKLTKIDLGFNEITELNSGIFKELGALQSLLLNNNNLSNIEEDTFNGADNLFKLDLSFNNLVTLKSNIFQNSKFLVFLYLNNNGINVIEDEAFNGLLNLQELNLTFNNLTKLNTGIFRSLKVLKTLSLQNNKIDTIEKDAFIGLKKLETLNLYSNRLVKFIPNMFQNLNHLRYLYVQKNGLVDIEEHSFGGLTHLKHLDLSNNNLTKLRSNIFLDLKILHNLYLNNNTLQGFDVSSFHGLHRLELLALENNIIWEIDKDLFRDMDNLRRLTADEYRFCCLKRNLEYCWPPPNEFSSCDDLMTSIVLRICIWILGIIAIIANIFVIIIRTWYTNKNMNKAHSFLIKNLALSDLFMGLYLLIIAFADTYYRGEYYLFDLKWRMSFGCNLAGFLSTFSSELTVFTLTVITIDRLLSILFPFRIRQGEINRTMTLMGTGWIFAAMISLVPLPYFQVDYFDNFYGRSGVCLPLHLTNDKPRGWEYSVIIFIVLNAISFAIIAICYISIHWSASKSQKSISSSNRTSGKALAFRMTLLVSADAACWIPIILLGIGSLANLKISPKIYAWIAVFVLPLNAALNPVLYTISSILPSFVARFKGKKGVLSHFKSTLSERHTSSTTLELEIK